MRAPPHTHTHKCIVLHVWFTYVPIQPLWMRLKHFDTVFNFQAFGIYLYIFIMRLCFGCSVCMHFVFLLFIELWRKFQKLVYMSHSSTSFFRPLQLGIEPELWIDDPKAPQWFRKLFNKQLKDNKPLIVSCFDAFSCPPRLYKCGHWEIVTKSLGGTVCVREEAFFFFFLNLSIHKSSTEQQTYI